MEHDTQHPLFPRPRTDITTPDRRNRRVMAVVTADILERARAPGLGAARFPVGDYLLREPDYRQILCWAVASGLAPEEVLEQLAKSSMTPYNHVSWNAQHAMKSIGFAVEDGAMVSVVWDFDVFPFIPGRWESGLLIQHLGVMGHWPDVATALRPVLPRLRTLFCGSLGLELLDLSPVTGLVKLHCGSNNLTELDLSQTPCLTELDCEYNNLTELDLSPTPDLAKLHCGNNNFTELDLSPVPDLAEFHCEDNNLTALDLSPVPGLSRLNCEFNELTELDLTPVPGLIELYCRQNDLTELDLSPVPGLSKLDCCANNLTELDLSPTPDLTELNCMSNTITKLDFSLVPCLTELDCEYNNLTELDLSPSPGLTRLRCDEFLRLRNAPAGIKVKHGFFI